MSRSANTEVLPFTKPQLHRACLSPGCEEKQAPLGDLPAHREKRVGASHEVFRLPASLRWPPGLGATTGVNTSGIEENQRFLVSLSAQWVTGKMDVDFAKL